MQVGDLVKYKETTEWAQWNEWIGIIIREIPGTDQRKVVHWLNNDERGSFRECELEMIK
tara:strand:- start:73 stop:249 length:177 start_codon:yes stop_codon:yes gene_type:complete